MQLSSGIGGPPECAYAVGGVFRVLQREFPSIRLADARPTGTEGCFSSITFTCEEDLSGLEGTVLWVCKSPLRPHHRRTKNRPSEDRTTNTSEVNPSLWTGSSALRPYS